MVKKSKLDIIELWRFIGCCIVMAYHSYTMGREHFSYPFSGGWVFVEFFFILTGYFTFLHFHNYEYTSINEMAKNAIRYTIKKFAIFLPYTSVMMILKCIAAYKVEHRLSIFLDMVPEMMLVTKGDMLIGTLWFLYAMFTVFPVFCCLCQIKQKYCIYILALFITLLYYNNYDSVIAPQYLLRAFSGLMLGVVVFFIVSLLRQIDFHKHEKIVITIIEQGSLLLVILITYKNVCSEKFILLCYVIGVALMLSEKTYSKDFNSRVVKYLGRLSMVVYIVHFPIADIVNLFFANRSVEQKLVLYYVSSLGVSVLLYFIVEKVKKNIDSSRFKGIEI